MKKSIKKICLPMMLSAIVLATTACGSNETESSKSTTKTTQATTKDSQTTTKNSQTTTKDSQTTTQQATQSPTQPTTQPPTQPVTQPPTQPVTQPPTQPATQPPTQPVTQPPTQPEPQTTISIKSIINQFNNDSIVSTYENLGGSIKAVEHGNSFKIVLNLEGKTTEIPYKYKNNILSIELDEAAGEYCFTASYMTMYVLDLIGELQGYRFGQLSETAKSDPVENYTLEKEGLEIEKVSDKKRIIKIDLSKKIPLADNSNTYLKVKDLESMKEFISGDGFVQKSKGPIKIYKDGSDGQQSVLISESGGITDKAYNSILSIIEIMFNNADVTNYFKANAKDLNTDKSFAGFVIDVNPEDKTSFESSVISDKNCVRVSIDMEAAIAAAKK